MREIQGSFVGEGRRFAIVVSRFNAPITERLLEGALDAFRRHGVAEDDLTVVRTPGAFEIPPVARTLAESARYDAVVCLGAVIRGGTPHFDYVAAEVSHGIARAHYETGVPVLFGIVTADTIEQAEERSGTKMGNRGFDAALSALEMADLGAKLGPARRREARMTVRSGQDPRTPS